VHQSVRLDAETGARLCAACAPGRVAAARVVECWPAEVAAWLRLRQPGRPLAPEHAAGCARAAAEDAAPHVLAPADGLSVVLEDGAEGPQRLMLQAASRSGQLFWFVDGTFVAATDPLEPAFWPLARGRHSVVCALASGASRSVSVVVR
jgi:penicillin-binding protein 1C